MKDIIDRLALRGIELDPHGDAGDVADALRQLLEQQAALPPAPSGEAAQEVIARVSAILSEAGFAPMPEGPLAGVFCRQRADGGFVLGGVNEAIGEVHSWDAGLSSRTTNDPIKAAEKLAAYARAKLNPLSTDATLDMPRVEVAAETQSLFGEPAEAAYGGEDETHGETGGEAPASEHQDDGGAGLFEASGFGEPDAESDGLDSAETAEMGGPVSGDPTDAGPDGNDAGATWESAEDPEPVPAADDFTDADFAPIEDEPPERDALDADLIPLRGIAWDENTVADEEAAASTEGPIAYAASDLDALVREKLGRVSQIARELKAALQDGWTIDEFRSLQNLIVRIDRGEATDDAQARARFVAISERSQAMSRVDAHRDALEAALDAIGKARDYQGAKDFNPEVGWP